MGREPEVTIRHNLKPGEMGYIIHLHGALYLEEYNFDISFETYVAIPLAELVQRKSDKERVWVVEEGSEIVGSMAVARHSDEESQLRWLLLHPRVRGRGIGEKLVLEAMEFSREKGYKSIFLWTVDVCKEAGELYLKLGFEITEEKPNENWEDELVAQRYERKL
jgi:N-acetylglutamate synthase-like GNAT family acetyltransferase